MNKNLLKILICPKSKGPYPIENSISIMLIEKARKIKK